MGGDAVCFVYVTAATKREALALGRALVRERLVACVNVWGGMRSVYRWHGRVQEAGEAVLVAKTRRGLSRRLVARVRELHSYDCPCVVLLPVAGGNPDYLAWVRAQTQGPDRRKPALAASGRPRSLSVG